MEMLPMSLFESLCFRDLKAYSAAWGGRVSYYRDRYGLEADCVLHLEDGRYALIEVKLGERERWRMPLVISARLSAL